MIDVPLERIEDFVADALDELPEELATRMDNVVVVVSDAPPGRFYGLYEGIPLTSRRGYGTGLPLPDRITIYRRTILERCRTEAEVAKQVRKTVLHEVGHHFGMPDSRLRELGW
jgi:predicted Zn-dependent protease with MMP-like domain